MSDPQASVSKPGEPGASEPLNRIAVGNLLDRAHGALRRVDAGDQTKALPEKDADAVSDAISAIEEFCRERSIRLSEFGDSCACPDPDAKACSRQRYGDPVEQRDGECECACHVTSL